MLKKSLFLFMAAIMAASMANAEIIGTYVDASDLNTDASTGPAVPWIGTTDTDGLWSYRDDYTDVMEGGGLWTGQVPADENPVELKTTISGLIPGDFYNIHTVFVGHRDADWNIGAGFASGSLTMFVYNDGLSVPTGKTAGGDSLIQLQALIGTVMADVNGEVDVYIDRMDVNGRSWYDGVSYEHLAGIVGTYVDADESSTVASAGGAWTGGGAGAWLNRTDYPSIMEEGDIWEGTDTEGGVTADVPELVTTITGLIAGATYDIGVVSVDSTSANGAWTISAGFASGALIEFSHDDGVSVRTGKTEQNGYLAQIQSPLGTAIADANGNINVYVDQINSSSSDDRSWYDGVTYEFVAPPVPEPSTLLLLICGIMGCVAMRLRSRNS